MEANKITLTDKELTIMKAGRTNCFGDCYNNPEWLFAVIDESKLDPKVARGVISSLIKKGLVEVWDNDGENVLEFTDIAKKMCDDGEINIGGMR